MTDTAMADVPSALSPPDSKLSDVLDSDSDLSSIAEEVFATEPTHWDGGVPVFEPSMDDFHDFQKYMKGVNPYGMKSGIVKVRPPKEWLEKMPRYDEIIKPIKLKDAIKQDIMGTGGTYRQANILSMRSYNLPQWKALSLQSDHQPPAKRGERRANVTSNSRSAAKPRPKKAGIRKSKKADDSDEDSNRLPTPDSHEDSDGEKKQTTVSARRKYNRKEAATKIDEAAFKDFDYELHEDYPREKTDELERNYWKTLTYAPPLYGADMMGTLFDDSITEWNLNKLPNLLDVLDAKIPGVNTAYLYLGMWKATFAWHLEDVDLYSINFLHFGAPKQWYSISQADARRFEDAMKSIWPADAKSCDQFLRHKGFLISPSTLKKDYGIQVNKIVHHPGEFVITFPYGYHSGYNLGYNVAEAVNFALEEWMDFGRIAKRCDCALAQDSVWINIREIERKLNGEPTDDELTEYESEGETEDENSIADLPTPPGEAPRIKISNNKRKRSTKDADGRVISKVPRIKFKTAKEPCELCPNDHTACELLPTPDGKRVHRRCAEYIPETYVEKVGGTDMVLGIDKILKARKELKCIFCRSKKGACFQCSQGKCSRSYHATCALAAGCWIEEGDTPVYGEDGTEYTTQGIEFSCRFHRAKRDKKLDDAALRDDARFYYIGTELKKGDEVQFQYLNSDYFAGVVVENRRDEGILLIDLMPTSDLVEVEYRYIRTPDSADYRMVKPSVNAIPLPKTTMSTSARHADNAPRKGDVFLPGYTWAEYSDFVPQKIAQAQVDMFKTEQIWFYLPKTSTEARSQWTEDPSVQQHNPRANVIVTVPRPSSLAVPKPSLGAAFPISKSNQNALNASRAVQRQSLPANLSRTEKPYIYKPRVGDMGGHHLDQRAYDSQQSFVHSTQTPQQRPSVAFGSDPQYQATTAYHGSYATSPPRKYEGLDNSAGTMSQSYHKKEHQAGHLTPPNVSIPPHVQAQAKNGDTSNPARLGKYPYFEKDHNQPKETYRSPYHDKGGFTNGWQSNPKTQSQHGPTCHRERTPAVHDLTQAQQKSNPLPDIHNSGNHSYQGSRQYNPSPTLSKERHEEKHPVSRERWDQKSSALHPAIRPTYSNAMFHQTYQSPPVMRANNPPDRANYSSQGPKSYTSPGAGRDLQHGHPPCHSQPYISQSHSAPLPSLSSLHAAIVPTPQPAHHHSGMALPPLTRGPNPYVSNIAHNGSTSLAAYSTSAKPGQTAAAYHHPAGTSHNVQASQARGYEAGGYSHGYNSVRSLPPHNNSGAYGGERTTSSGPSLSRHGYNYPSHGPRQIIDVPPDHSSIVDKMLLDLKRVTGP